MRQLTLSLLSLIAVAATLFAAGPQQVLACSCAGIQPTEEFAREVLNAHDLVIVGEVTSHKDAGQDLTRAEVKVERTFGFRGPKKVTIETDNGSAGCGYGASLREDGSAHFLMLIENDDVYGASYCTSFPVYFEGDSVFATEEQMLFLNELALLAVPIRVVEERERPSFDRYGRNDEAAPTALTAAYAAGSLATLAALWAVRRGMLA